MVEADGTGAEAMTGYRDTEEFGVRPVGLEATVVGPAALHELE
jgi:hypothetical protein